MSLGQTASCAVIDRLAQVCHCFAQGKIGSGFDVSAAIYGSHLYRRFSPQLIQSLEQNVTPSALRDLIHGVWDQEQLPFSLPLGLNLILADVDAGYWFDLGSNTPMLVSKVLEWRRNDPHACEALWKNIDAANTCITRCLNELSLASNHPDYQRVRLKLGQSCARDWNTLDVNLELRNLFVEIYQQSLVYLIDIESTKTPQSHGFDLWHGY